MSPATGGGWDTGKIPLEICPDPAAHALPARETTLDEAWAAAEKALPEGCVIESVMRVDTSDSEDINDEQWEWEAEASSERGQRSVTATGSTPAAALHALAVALGRSGSDR